MALQKEPHIKVKRSGTGKTSDAGGCQVSQGQTPSLSLTNVNPGKRPPSARADGSLLDVAEYQVLAVGTKDFITLSCLQQLYVSSSEANIICLN